jgi:subtilase family serine protease
MSLKIAAAGVATALVVLGTGFTAGATTTTTTTDSASANTLVPVPGDLNPAALPGAVATGVTPGSTQETVSFVLTEQNLKALEFAVTHGITQYDSVLQFAQTYGQSPKVIFELQKYLGKFGITTQVYADDVDVVAMGTAAEFDAALGTHQQQFNVPQQTESNGQTIAAQTIHGTTHAPSLPAYLAKYVTAILGLTDYASFLSSTQHVDTNTASAQPGNSSSCIAMTGLPNACNTPESFAATYGLDPLYKAGDNGAGQTIGIVTLAAVDKGAPEYFWQHVLGLQNTGRSVTIENVDGGPGAPSDAGGTPESDLDVEQSGGVAPGANVVVYQAPNTDPGFADSFFDAASQDIAGSVSTSWGESETYLASVIASGTETSGYLAAFNEAFLELAAQGQSAFCAAGDAGAYDASRDIGTTNLSVDTPADSPYITASGGTTLPWTGKLKGSAGSVTVTVPTERTWGWDYLWQPIASITGSSVGSVARANAVGGGGGFSLDFGTPAYQQGVSGTGTYSGVPYLTPKDYQPVGGLVLPTKWSFTADPSVVQGQAYGRAVPDVSTDADPYSGYLLYSPSFSQGGTPVLEGGWGGTSFVGPQLNGVTAVFESSLGHRIGFWNPAIYRFAQGGKSPFTPLQKSGTSNDNVFYTGTPGALYNQGVGLGTPNLSALDKAFASS